VTTVAIEESIVFTTNCPSLCGDLARASHRRDHDRQCQNFLGELGLRTESVRSVSTAWSSQVYIAGTSRSPGRPSYNSPLRTS
jgi:hypothetical protein